LNRYLNDAFDEGTTNFIEDGHEVNFLFILFIQIFYLSFTPPHPILSFFLSKALFR